MTFAQPLKNVPFIKDITVSGIIITNCKQFSVTSKLHCKTNFYISAGSLSALIP
jgi:hypothetical protein